MSACVSKCSIFSTRDRVDCSGGGGWDSIKAKWMERVRVEQREPKEERERVSRSEM